MAEVQLILGLPQSGKTTRCLAAYTEALLSARESHSFARTLWLTPAKEARQLVLERLLALTGGVVFQPCVQTFDQFAERVLEETQQGGQAVTAMARRLILRAVIGELNRNQQLVHFGKIAATEGFLDVVSNFVSELKRAEIWPEEFRDVSRRSSGKPTPRDRELCALYERYQQVLLDRNWYDAEGRFWLARTAMREHPSGFWRDLSLVVVDGFSDFTKTQQEMLEQLALASRRMILTLPGEESTSRTELFAKPGKMTRDLQALFSGAGRVTTVFCQDDPASFPAGIQHIQQELFENPRDISRSDTAAGVAMVVATGDASEKAAVGLRIKRLLQTGTSPRDIVVGLRSASESGQAWVQSLDQAGIPACCEVPLPWSRSPYLKALFGLLQLVLEDWPFDRLQGVLTSSLFRPPISEWNSTDGPRRITGLLRRGKFHSQREQILRGFDRWRQRALAGDPDGDLPDLQFAISVLTQLSETLQLMSAPANLAQWADRLATVTSRLGLVQRTADPTDLADVRDAEQLQRLLRAAAVVEQQLAEPACERTLEELLVILRDLVQTDPPESTAESPGCVRVVGAETLRHLQPKHLFLVGLTEDAFPSRRAEDCLFSEAERVRFAQDGLSLNHREAHRQEEMLLFYQAVTRATSQLTLSYSQVNAQGHEVYASPYLTALEQLFDPRAKMVSHEGELDPVPAAEQVLTASDLRLAAVSEARHKRPGWWRLLLENVSTAPMARNVLAATVADHHRFHTHGFTGYEGRLSQLKHLNWLAKKFDSNRQFSATELELYAQCPFRFWVASVLELEPLPSPEEATDFAGRGRLVHQVLAKLAEENPAEAATVSQRFRELVEERLDRQITENELQQALLQVEKLLLDRWATAYGEQHCEYAARVTEQQLTVSRTLTEVPFGAARDAESADPQTRFPALEVRNREQVIRLGGRIDRVDVSEWQGQQVFTVIDYKSGSSKHQFQWDDVSQGRTLQLAIYTLAVARLQIAGPDAVPYQMGYWTVRQTGFKACGGSKSGAPLDAVVRETLESLLSETIFRLVAGIRSGQFVVDSLDDNCTGSCPYHTVCRVNQVRSLSEHLEKRRVDPLSPPGGLP